ncbi:MAG: HAD hydrolase family protein [Phycisphaerales bacterium]|nr:HAD hydrolase family protein [Phycisphaerales bacterium]
MPEPRYDIIAIDIDGTLFDSSGQVSEANIAALADARRAGIEIVLCTGRGYPESVDAVHAVGAHHPSKGRNVAPIVVSGGAMIVDAAAGKTMHRWAIPQDLVQGVCALFASMRRAPLLLKDRDAAGFDYLVIKTGPIEPPTEWWFNVMPVEVRYVDRLDQDEHPEHTVRVGFAAHHETMVELATKVRDQFGRDATIHHFAAVSSGGAPVNGATEAEARRGGKDRTIQLLEVFNPSVSKWTAIHRLALEQQVPRERVCAIGDEVNDVAMIEGAGLGIAMANAIAPVKAAAEIETRSNDDDGVAYAIEQILSGAW